MKGKLILTLSLTGVAMGLVTLYLPTAAEAFCWLGIFLLSAWQVAKRAPEKPFINGFLVGVVNIAWQMLIRVSFIGIYMAHHAKEAAQAAKVEYDVHLAPVAMMLVMTPFVALFYGLVLGLFSTVAAGIMADS